ncbi:outer membrane protein OmpK [Parendozoicomonas haliclonae]|uniref:Nucleoside-specific channel-forming protein, Tsx n=2 Tax=Parendozoicomonas haliclonae TaxID=1960125 RepID=A0A1X7APW8_9GAMM|nr:hypothetical protein EHSB41UT_03953 [Parendozoicomonas haliclonae]
MPITTTCKRAASGLKSWGACAGTALLLSGMGVSTAQAEYLWGFGDVSVNWLDWSDGTEKRTHHGKSDFLYLELEGGALFDWGEMYGFFDLENPQNTSNENNGNHDRRTALKGNLRYFFGDTGFNLYLHSYNFSTPGFNEQDQVIGLGYNLNGGSFWWKPFIGYHGVTSSGYSGSNGYMMGWVLGYSFKLGGQDFLISNWHETEFNRNNKYKGNLQTGISNGEGGFKNLQQAGRSLKDGENGAVALWWTPIKEVTAGIQYRYAYYKLGKATYQDAAIFSLRYNF